MLRDHQVEDCSTGEAYIVSLPLSKASVAYRLSLMPEYFSTVLHELKSMNLIRIDVRDIHIVDVPRLARYGDQT